MAEKTFLTGQDGEQSSKRIGFAVVLATTIITSVVVIAFAIKHDKYNEAVLILDSMWFACFGFCGAIATEAFAKRNKNNNNEPNS